jgi:hypothetical protein
MKRSFIHDLRVALVVSVLAAPLLCCIAGCGGTETGNPGSNPADQIPHMLDNPAIGLMDSICGKLTSCLEGLDESTCRSSVSASTELGTRFGAGPEDYPSFIDVIAAADAQTLRVDTAQLGRCTAAIGDLRCDGEEILAVEIQGSVVANLEQMIPENGCPYVFSPVQ